MNDMSFKQLGGVKITCINSLACLRVKEMRASQLELIVVYL